MHVPAPCSGGPAGGRYEDNERLETPRPPTGSSSSSSSSSAVPLAPCPALQGRQALLSAHLATREEARFRLFFNAGF